MDLKNSKTQKVLLLVMVAFVGAYFWHAKVYTGYQQKIDASYLRLESLQTELKEVEMKFRSLESLKAEYSDLTSRYQTIAQLLPEDNQLSPLLSKVHAAALETSSRVGAVKPLQKESQGFYDREGYQLMVHSTYHDLGDFLSRLSNMPFIVNVDDVQMTSDDEREHPEAEGGGFTVTAAITIATYHVKESERLVLLDHGDDEADEQVEDAKL